MEPAAGCPATGSMSSVRASIAHVIGNLPDLAPEIHVALQSASATGYIRPNVVKVDGRNHPSAETGSGFRHEE